jgi:hypothetical protein
MKPETSLWVNRVGLLLDFLAFWFAAPELLGEKRLRSIELALKGPLDRIVGLGGVILKRNGAILGRVGAFAGNIGRSAGSIEDALRRSRQTLRFVESEEGIPVIEVANTTPSWGWALISVLFILLSPIILVAALVLIIAFLILLIAAYVFTGLTLLIFWPIRSLALLLADSSKTRQRSLIVGACIFVLGFALQITATF